MPSSDRAPDSDSWSRAERRAPARATSGADPGRRALTDGLRAGAVQREPAGPRPVAASRSTADAADGADVATGADIAPVPGGLGDTGDAALVGTAGDDSASILDRDGGSYRDMLDANMRPRGGETPDVARARIERTLVIMAESPGGRVALFGDGPEQRAAVVRDADPILHAALAQALGDEAALAQVLARIEQTMVGDCAGMSGTQAAVMRQMRDLGFHDDAGAPPSTP